MAIQAVIEVDTLPADGLAAASHFYASHLDEAQQLLARDDVDALAIALPVADFDHTDWRRTLAHDLARVSAPKRVNLVASDDASERQLLLQYLAEAPGVTGQYLQGTK